MKLKGTHLRDVSESYLFPQTYYLLLVYDGVDMDTQILFFVLR